MQQGVPDANKGTPRKSELAALAFLASLGGSSDPAEEPEEQPYETAQSYWRDVRRGNAAELNKSHIVVHAILRAHEYLLEDLSLATELLPHPLQRQASD